VKRSAILLSLAVLALGLLGVSSAANRPLAGDLDPSFGNGGVVTYNTGTKEEYAYVGGIALQPNGKIVVAGGAVPGNHGLILARYKPDGSLDPGFGKKGMVETPIKYWAFADSVALQPDGKIVIAGRSYDGTDANVLSTFILARYNLDGSLDSTFGYGESRRPPSPMVRATRMQVHTQLRSSRTARSSWAARLTGVTELISTGLLSPSPVTTRTAPWTHRSGLTDS